MVVCRYLYLISFRPLVFGTVYALCRHSISLYPVYLLLYPLIVVFSAVDCLYSVVFC